MARARAGLHRLIDQSSLGSADSLASLSKMEEETIAQDAELWGHINRYPSYTDISATPQNSEHTVLFEDSKEEGDLPLAYSNVTFWEESKEPGGVTKSAQKLSCKKEAESVGGGDEMRSDPEDWVLKSDGQVIDSPCGYNNGVDELDTKFSLMGQTGLISGGLSEGFSGGVNGTVSGGVSRRFSGGFSGGVSAGVSRKDCESVDDGVSKGVNQGGSGRVSEETTEGGNGHSIILESLASALQEIAEKQARAERETSKWRAKYEQEFQRAVSAEERLAAVYAQSAGNRAPDVTSSPLEKGAIQSVNGAPCLSEALDVSGRKLLQSGTVAETCRTTNKATDGTSPAISNASWHTGEAATSQTGEAATSQPGAGDDRKDFETKTSGVADGGVDGDPKAGSPRKAHFKLAWRSADGVETTHRHRHEIVSYERGNISNMARSNKQVAFIWKSPPQAVLVVRKPNSPRVSKMVNDVVQWLTCVKKLTVVLEPAAYVELLDGRPAVEEVETWQEEDELLYLHQRVDLVVTLGGDGTVLWASSLFKGPVPPVVSFAMGSLGFVTPFQIERYQECLSSLLKGPIYLTLRNRIQCRIVKNGADADPRGRDPPFERLVLNEVALDRGMSSFLTNLECYCDGDFMTTVQGDGLIVSTPSGSTAYSLSAGGSMVHPQVPGILFTPICPHSLSFRPLILPEYVCLQVHVPFNSRGQAWVSFDGRDRQQLCAGDALILEMSHWPVPAACREDPTQDFLNSARGNLHWNLRKTQE